MPEIGQNEAFNRATSLAKLGRMDEACDALEALIRQATTFVPARLLMASIRTTQGRLDSAERHVRAALATVPEHVQARQMLMSILTKTGRLVDAQHLGEKLLQEPGVPAHILFTIGSDLNQCHAFESALAAFRRVLEMRPHHRPVVTQCASVLQRLGRTDESLQLLYDELQRDPADIPFRSLVASRFERANRLEEARQILMEAPSDVDNPALLVVRGGVALREGQTAEARQLLERALTSGDGLPLYLHPLTDSERLTAGQLVSQACERMGDYQEAFRWTAATKPSIADLSGDERAKFQRLDEFMAECQSRVTREMVARWTDPPPDVRRAPIFMIGFPRSGTTLLEQILAAHPDIVTTDETPAMHKVMEVLSLRAGGLHQALTFANRLKKSDLLSMRDVYWREIDQHFRDDSAATRLVLDKHPLNGPHLLMVRRLFPGAKVLFAVRDPRDVCLSCFANLSETPLAINYFHSLESTASYYNSVVGLGLHFKETLGLPWMEVTYEQVIADTRGMAQKVIDFAGVPWTDEVMQYAEKASRKFIRTPSYQAVTKTTNRSAEGRWRHYAQHFDKANRILRPYIERFGYAE